MSAQRILTTHTGSLPRPADLIDLLEAYALGKEVDAKLLERRIAEEVRAIVRRQADCGIDIVNDGETSKHNYSAYVKDRLSGFTRNGAPRTIAALEAADFPEYAARRLAAQAAIIVPVCEGPIAYVGHDLVERDCRNLRAALEGVDVAGAFMSAASPGVVARFIENRHYPSHEAYVFAIADAMKTEYDAIHRAGLILQVDCPDLTGNRDIPGMVRGADYFQIHLEALNHAVRDIPPAAMRMHLCWGNYEGPHHLDTPLRNIVERVFAARPQTISLEAANPRHGHEWTVFRDIPLPAGRAVIPGVLDTTTNFVEHPDYVALRIEQFASVVGRERVTAGTDCGFATSARSSTVDPTVAWAKLRAMVEGARIASSHLW
jgi:5-methyltetrahydropteroyltriglutamate--homocysteine methyltransferase